MSTSRDPSNPDDGHSLQELSELTGIEMRTIRSYVGRGLIPAPDSLGRGARYQRATLDRLRVMQLLRDSNRNVSLDQLRVLLQSLTPSQIAAIADGNIKIGALIDTDATLSCQPPAAASTPPDALSYLRSVRAFTPMATGGADPSEVCESRTCYPGTDPDLSSLAQAAQALTALAGVAASARSTRGEAWYRIGVTPDLELNVRGHFGDEELAHFHRIADALRNLLTKGPVR